MPPEPMAISPRCPAVLVECGFLSNAEETLRLRQADYQMTLAVTIAAGYLQWAAGEEPI